jgi:type I restriction enzyme R subunit
VYDHRKARLVEFVQHILGIRTLEAYAETVSKAFEQFTAAHTYLSSRQLEFMNLLKTFIIDRGEVVRKNLIEAPFTRIHPDGIRGVFTREEMKEIFTLIDEIAA